MTGSAKQSIEPEEDVWIASSLALLAMMSSERTDRKIAQPQIGVAPFFPEPEQRPVEGLPQQIVALAHGDADALAEIAAFDERAARERAAFPGIGPVDPQCQRDCIAKNEVDLAAP